MDLAVSSTGSEEKMINKAVSGKRCSRAEFPIFPAFKPHQERETFEKEKELFLRLVISLFTLGFVHFPY